MSNLYVNQDITAPLVITNQSNIIIRNCTFTNAALKGKVAITLSSCTNAIVEDCYFENTNPVYALNSSFIDVINNTAISINAPIPRGQFFQGNNCTAPINVIGNFIDNSNKANVDAVDIINIFQCTGDPSLDHYILLKNNIILYGGTNTSGGGIMTGDQGGSDQIVQGNYVYIPGQYGIAVAGGSNMAVIENDVYSPQTDISNVGIYSWNFHDTDPPCDNISVIGNRVRWTNKDGYNNPYWTGGNRPCTNTYSHGNNWKWIGPTPTDIASLEQSVDDGDTFIPGDDIAYGTPGSGAGGVGPAGAQGPVGAQGPAGTAGPIGLTGSGSAGKDGEDGEYASSTLVYVLLGAVVLLFLLLSGVAASVAMQKKTPKGYKRLP